MIRICESIGIDATMYTELIEEMYWDGFCAAEIKQQIEVLEGDYSLWPKKNFGIWTPKNIGSGV